MSPLKVVAPENMSFMLVTAETSQEEMSWLKEVAPLNMPTRVGDGADVPA